MTPPAQTVSRPANHGDYNETIMAALLDALCAPQLYEIVMRGGELFIKPRPGMHPRLAEFENPT